MYTESSKRGPNFRDGSAYDLDSEIGSLSAADLEVVANMITNAVANVLAVSNQSKGRKGRITGKNAMRSLSSASPLKGEAVEVEFAASPNDQALIREAGNLIEALEEQGYLSREEDYESGAVSSAIRKAASNPIINPAIKKAAGAAKALNSVANSSTLPVIQVIKGEMKWPASPQYNPSVSDKLLAAVIQYKRVLNDLQYTPSHTEMLSVRQLVRGVDGRCVITITGGTVESKHFYSKLSLLINANLFSGQPSPICEFSVKYRTENVLTGVKTTHDTGPLMIALTKDASAPGSEAAAAEVDIIGHYFEAMIGMDKATIAESIVLSPAIEDRITITFSEFPANSSLTMSAPANMQAIRQINSRKVNK